MKANRKAMVARPPGMEELKLSIYGLRLTRRKYLLLQVGGFVWLLALYGIWKGLGLEHGRGWFVSHLDLFLLPVYLYGVAETVVVLRRFRRAAERGGGSEEGGGKGGRGGRGGEPAEPDDRASRGR